MKIFFIFISAYFFCVSVIASDSFSSFHKNYVTENLKVKQIDAQIILNILDKIYHDEEKACNDYGNALNLINNQFYIKDNPFSILNITADHMYDIVIDTKQFVCSESGRSLFRGGTGGRLFIFILNPTIDNINNWIGIEKAIPFIQIGEKQYKVSDNGVYNVFARSWAYFNDQIIFEIHGSFCNEAGALQCFIALDASFDEGFTQVTKPTHMKSINEFDNYLLSIE